jgi:hypothetical protein
VRRLLGILLIALGGAFAAHGADEKIIKVLPHLLDEKGRHTLSPSLYERDAYQAYLRKNPEKCSGLRFDIHWRASDVSGLTLRIEFRGSKAPQSFLLEKTMERRRGIRQWTSLTISRDEFQKMGDLIAWRASVWKGDQMLAKQESFLW